MTKQRAIELGWTVQLETVIPFDDLPIQRYMLINPAGSSENPLTGWPYAGELGCETDDAAWKYVEGLAEDIWQF